MVRFSASTLLFGSGFVWGSYDKNGVATAMLKGTLEELCQRRSVKLQMICLSFPAQMSEQETILGLALWTVESLSEIEPICASLATLRERHPDTVCAVLVDPTLHEYAALLVESGAQIVVSRLTSLERAVLRAAMHGPLSTQGFHPLTMGLNHLLPWPETSHGDGN